MVWIRSWFLKPFLAFKSFMFRVHMCCPYLPVVILLSFTIIYHVYHQFRIIIASQPPKQIIYTTICHFKKNLQHFFSRLPFVSWNLLQAPMPCVTCCLLNFAMTRHPTTMRIAWQGHRHGHAWQPWCIIMYHPGGNVDKMEGIMEIQHFFMIGCWIYYHWFVG